MEWKIIVKDWVWVVGEGIGVAGVMGGIGESMDKRGEGGQW